MKKLKQENNSAQVEYILQPIKFLWDVAKYSWSKKFAIS